MNCAIESASSSIPQKSSVRKAIAYSIDRKSIASAGFGGYADLLPGLLPASGFSDVTPSLNAAQQFLNQLPAYDFDPAKAKAELAQSAYPHGFTTTVTYSGTVPWIKLLLLNLQQNLQPLGVTINLNSVTQQEWFQTWFSHRATGLQVFPTVGVSNSDPSTLLPAMVGKASMVPNFLNNANFTTPAIETAYPALAPRTAGGYSTSQRWQATQTVLSEVADQVPYVPLYSPQTVYALAKGYVFTQTPSFSDLISGSWIDYLRAAT